MMINILTNRITTVARKMTVYNIEVPNDFFTQRVLTDFAYRERNLEQFRKKYVQVNTN
jgi:hypothetical protein